MVHVKANTLISQYSFLCTSGHDYTQPDLPLYYADIEIGAGCRIAAGAFIGPGVTIGDGAEIGAHSVVSHNMPPGMVCAGNPCHPIRPREMKAVEPVASIGS
jgi:putative colanic acid biosynthesis acetyltransferase WcaF